MNFTVVELKCTWCLVHLNLSWIICQELNIDEDSIWEGICLDIFQSLWIVEVLRNLVLSWYLKNNANNIRFLSHKKCSTQSQTREMYRCLSLIVSKTTLSLYISSIFHLRKKGEGEHFLISKTKKLCNNAMRRSGFKLNMLDCLSPSILFTKSAALNCYDDRKNLEGEESCASIEDKK